MAKSVKIEKEEYVALAQFRYALRQFMHFSESEAHEIGIAPQQHQALLEIRGYPEKDEVTIGELAERLQILHHSAVGLVDRMESHGLIARKHCDADKRQTFVEITDHGDEILQQLSVVHRAELSRLGPQLLRLLEQFAPKQNP